MEQVVTDKAGRKITLRRVGVVEQLRLYKALGPELSVNPIYMHAAFIAAAVAMIDNVPVPLPANEAALEAALERIGLDAMPIIGQAIASLSDAELQAQAGN